MIKVLKEYSKTIGNTPLVKLCSEDVQLFSKLEYNNYSGSMKDRAAFSILYDAIKKGKINQSTTVVASSSGNLAIAIATICRKIGVKFIPVIDPNISKDYENLLNLISSRVEKVTEIDKTGGYLLTRIDRVNSLCSELTNSFCADQYSDVNNFKGYYPLSREIISAVPDVDFVFVAVSSSGSITGISKSIKKYRSQVKIIGVDVIGSVIFGKSPKKRHVSGIGSSMVSPILKYAQIDDVIYVSQMDIIKGCHDLLNEQSIFAGASSGAVYFAAKQYFLSYPNKSSKAILIFPDRGSAYLNTIYNKDWIELISTQTEIF